MARCRPKNYWRQSVKRWKHYKQVFLRHGSIIVAYSRSSAKSGLSNHNPDYAVLRK